MNDRARRGRCGPTQTATMEVRALYGARYWWGADGPTEASEHGIAGVLALNARNFSVGTVLRMEEPRCGECFGTVPCRESACRGVEDED